MGSREESQARLGGGNRRVDSRATIHRGIDLREIRARRLQATLFYEEDWKGTRETNVYSAKFDVGACVRRTRRISSSSIVRGNGLTSMAAA